MALPFSEVKLSSGATVYHIYPSLLCHKMRNTSPKSVALQISL